MLEPPPLGDPVADPSPRARPRATALRGQSVELVPMDLEAHADALYEASHGTAELEQLWSYLPAGPFRDVTELAAWYARTGARGDPQFFTVVDAATGSPSGVVSYLAIEPDHGSIEIGHIWYAPRLQRTAANTEACYLMFTDAFDNLRYRRMEWKCDALNARSRAAALRLGFQFEGIFRQHRIVAGRNRDTAWFSILDSEWPAVRQGLEAWLRWDPSSGERPGLAELRSRAGASS